MINELANQIHENAKLKGFYDKEVNIGERLALIHSEVSEALEADRKGKYTNPDVFNSLENYDLIFKQFFEDTIKDTFEDEMADIVIRVLDLCAYKNINIEAHIKAKIIYNISRPHKHGKIY